LVFWRKKKDSGEHGYKELIEQVKKLIHRGFILVQGDEDCIYNHIVKYYESVAPNDVVKIVLPPEPGDIIYFVKKSSILEAVLNRDLDNVVAVEVYRAPFVCQFVVWEARDKKKRDKFLEDLPKILENEIVGRGVPEETEQK
jgi:hypothetical protein